MAVADADAASAAPSVSECPFDGAASGTGRWELFKSLPSSNVPGSSSSSISLVSAVSELIALIDEDKIVMIDGYHTSKKKARRRHHPVDGSI